MIRMVRAKQAIAVVAVLLGVLVGGVVVRQAATSVLRATQGADPASAFHDTLTTADEVRAVVDWLPDDNRASREMEPLTRDEITEAYASAWSALDRAGQGDAAAPLTTYLSGGALAQGQALLAQPMRCTTRHVAHQLRLTFYSDDGAVVALDVPTMSVVRTFGAGAQRIEVPSSEHLRLVMVLEDGNWRVQMVERVN